MSFLYKYPCPENNITCYPIELTLVPGQWKIELWGAGTNSGGGYTRGILSLYHKLTLYAYLGGQEMPYGDQCGVGGYNGGGNSTKTGIITTKNYCRQSGGNGASDIRLTEGNLDSRIMVAGGAGGGSACKVTEVNHIGGFGGGLTAGSGSLSGEDDATAKHIIGEGGTQDKGGTGIKEGSIGVGGEAQPSDASDCAGAGGGGYYGGGSGYDYEWGAAGGGGSSYIAGHKSCKSHQSIYYFKNPIMYKGNELMPQPEGEDKIGYIGQGAMRVTLVSSFCSNERMLIGITFNQFLPLLSIFFLL